MSCLLCFALGAMLFSNQAQKPAESDSQIPLRCLYVVENAPENYMDCRFPSMFRDVANNERAYLNCRGIFSGVTREQCLEQEARKQVEVEKEALLHMKKQLDANNK